MPRLNASFVKTTKAVGRFGDGRGGYGLALLVRPRAGGGVRKSWTQRVRVGGRATNLGLGQYPLVELAEARAKALENARAVAAGRDPRTSAAPTFEEAAQEVIRLRIPTWRSGSKSAEQWRASFRDYVYPVIGPKPVSEITPADVLAVLSPHWHDRAETMRRVKQRLGAVLDWAVAHGHASDNPARGAVVAAALPRQPGGRHQRALQPGDVAAALTIVDASGAHLSTRLTLRFIVLTACRSGEARNARWDEINTETATWTIPPTRTKTGRPFRVPLSSSALAVLGEARKLSDASGLVFPSVTGRPLSDNTVSKLLRENGVDAVPHGFRSSFRDWCAESGVAREIAEAALAHVVRDSVERAYFRSDVLERRREVMQRWADYLTV